MIVKTWMAARNEASAISETEVREALAQLDPLWDELFPAEQARIVQFAGREVDVGTDGIAIRFRTEGLASVVSDLQRRDQRKAA
jgi:hypothetical protein